MESKFKVLLNNSFLYKKSNTSLTKNYPDLNIEELYVFERFLINCYKKISYRNKESWWIKESQSKKIETDTARYFEEKCIWHLHVGASLEEESNGKYINHEIYPGTTAKYVICYYKEELNSVMFIHILSFSKHPHGVSWEEIENHISQIKYF